MSKTGRFVLGLGARAGVPGEELNAAVDVALRQAGLEPDAIAALATLDRRAAEAGVRAAAQRHGWEVIGFTAAELAAVDVPHASGLVAAATGTPSVAEAAALLAAGPDAVLVLPKTAFPRATVAVARGSLGDALTVTTAARRAGVASERAAR
ncbi:cobalamin biosynthesis protein [Actinoplanes auranticolor]|uniref:cobalamin biosynthesis protein n=1 Tax=Actinoplanes auranticolor TaxID=47988 RepID=UPI001BB36C66|nr:cobalamin biosynthesis protein [Actinoplanes auranticolor]